MLLLHVDILCIRQSPSLFPEVFTNTWMMTADRSHIEGCSYRCSSPVRCRFIAAFTSTAPIATSSTTAVYQQWIGVGGTSPDRSQKLHPHRGWTFTFLKTGRSENHYRLLRDQCFQCFLFLQTNQSPFEGPHFFSLSGVCVLRRWLC